MKKMHKDDTLPYNYPMIEVWNTTNSIAAQIVPRLQAFKALDRHSYPSDLAGMKEWNKVLQTMIDAFVLLRDLHSYSAEEKQIIDKGLTFFHKYFCDLWD